MQKRIGAFIEIAGQRALLALVVPARQEEGVVDYHVHRDRADPDLFVFYEAWRDVHALWEHLQSPAVSAFLDRRLDLIDGDLDIRWLRMVSEPK